MVIRINREILSNHVLCNSVCICEAYQRCDCLLRCAHYSLFKNLQSVSVLLLGVVVWALFWKVNSKITTEQHSPRSCGTWLLIHDSGFLFVSQATWFQVIYVIISSFEDNNKDIAHPFWIWRVLVGIMMCLFSSWDFTLTICHCDSL